MSMIIIPIVVFSIILFFSTIKQINQYERGIKFQFRKFLTNNKI